MEGKVFKSGTMYGKKWDGLVTKKITSHIVTVSLKLGRSGVWIRIIVIFVQCIFENLYIQPNWTTSYVRNYIEKYCTGALQLKYTTTLQYFKPGEIVKIPLTFCSIEFLF